MNSGFYEDLDTNFEEAFNMSGRNYTQSELLEMLRTGNIPQKQIAALNFQSVSTFEDAEVLMSNLTGCDGKIREAVAFKINQIVSSDEQARIFFAADEFSSIFADATIDINANICRLIVDAVKLLAPYGNFSNTYTTKIVSFASDALSELDKFIFRDKKYVINKQLFKLYWCLETLKNYYSAADENKILEILEKCSQQKEYTIREKTAQIAILSDKFASIAEMLKNDENYYVKSVFVSTQ